ncbi:MAG: hypothetical protein J6U64_01350, partial [Alphaproteobacteria bacterium]|nr:hypothetical protein [Alphaproteobacteria bacterium]
CTVGGCESEQECCGGKCITKCTGCNVCVPDSQSCSTDNRCSGDKPTCCKGQCICGACCQNNYLNWTVEGEGYTYQLPKETEPCDHACTSYISFAPDMITSAKLQICGTCAASEATCCVNKFYQKDGACKRGEYRPLLDTCCNPIEDRYCCTATDGESCMTVEECKEKNKVTECPGRAEGCCILGNEC